MDKKGGEMTRRAVLLFILLAFVISLSGCHTVKGAAEGAKQDYEDAQKADAWMRKNLW
jgi:predicted small secreted protein